uniref:C-type lectin domain-containing protein n=1 Tax=Cynoglossus semilaevis TaxID=244447 RepID=A0A3P8UQ97_CYNSE
MFSCYTTVSVSPCYRIWFNRSVPRNNSITLQQLRVTGLRPGISILFNVTSLIESELCLMGPPNHCYFFSVGLQEDLQWNESVKFCGRHNSSLAVIKDTSEMFPQFPFLWVGLTDSRQEGRWLWLDGADYTYCIMYNDSYTLSLSVCVCVCVRVCCAGCQ